MMDRRNLLKAVGLMVGAAVSPSCRQALESGVNLALPPTSGRLSDSQRSMIEVLAELIIPTTDTPGAMEAGVPAFIELIVVDWYTDAEQKIFLDGLAELDAAAERALVGVIQGSDQRTAWAAVNRTGGTGGRPVRCQCIPASGRRRRSTLLH